MIMCSQIEIDSKFLESQQIMDYSLLLGVHYRAPQHLQPLISRSRSTNADGLGVVAEEGLSQYCYQPFSYHVSRKELDSECKRAFKTKLHVWWYNLRKPGVMSPKCTWILFWPLFEVLTSLASLYSWHLSYSIIYMLNESHAPIKSYVQHAKYIVSAVEPPVYP